MKYEIRKQDGRFALYLYTDENGWYLHQSYLTMRGAETTVSILFDQGFNSKEGLPPLK